MVNERVRTVELLHKDGIGRPTHHFFMEDVSITGLKLV